MARAAIFGLNTVSVRYHLRHVCLMAIPAIGGGHFSRVRFVALGALRNFAVCTVTHETAQGRMFTLILPQLGKLLSVTAETRLREVRREGDFKRGVSVLVTVGTTFQLEMRFSLVALAALWNVILDFGRVSSVTA